MALRRERLTGRMNLALERLMANMDDPGWEKTTPVERLEARIQVALEVAHELAALVESLTQRVAALEAAQRAEGDTEGQEVGECAHRREAGLASIQLEAEASIADEEKSDG